MVHSIGVDERDDDLAALTENFDILLSEAKRLRPFGVVAERHDLAARGRCSACSIMSAFVTVRS